MEFGRPHITCRTFDQGVAFTLEFPVYDSGVNPELPFSQAKKAVSKTCYLLKLAQASHCRFTTRDVGPDVLNSPLLVTSF